MEDAAGACSCEACQGDALALALNKYPPKNGVSSPAAGQLPVDFEDFIRHEIGLIQAHACRVVCANPHH